MTTEFEVPTEQRTIYYGHDGVEYNTEREAIRSHIVARISVIVERHAYRGDVDVDALVSDLTARRVDLLRWLTLLGEDPLPGERPR